MMKKYLLAFLVSLLFLNSGMSFAETENGILNIRSSYNVNDTLDRLEKVLKEKGLNVFARIKHSEAAKKIGKELKPTELLIFGNPAVGTALMQNNRIIGLDLPLKALVWEDNEGNVWLTYINPEKLFKNHNLEESQKNIMQNIDKSLKEFFKSATEP